jgi:hypothetical protein
MFDAKFDPRAVQHYLTALREPARIHALCEDYRAGAYDDFEHDKTDLDKGTKISIPLHVIWGSRGIASAAATPMQTWQAMGHDGDWRRGRSWALLVRGEPGDYRRGDIAIHVARIERRENPASKGRRIWPCTNSSAIERGPVAGLAHV